VNSRPILKNNVKIITGGYSFIAEFVEEAPLTSEAFKKLLPYRQKVIHVRWSGVGLVIGVSR